MHSKPTIEIPGVGTLTRQDQLGWYRSGPLLVRMLGGRTYRLLVVDYENDPAKDDFHTAITNFLMADRSVLKRAEPHIFRYYEDCNDGLEPDDPHFVGIEPPADVWDHIRFGGEPLVSRRRRGDKGIYVSLECECDWEEEHGLQIVFQNGRRVNKVGPYDGHLTNSDAWADASLEDTIYKG